MFATRGSLPSRRLDGNTQSPGWEYVVFFFQPSMNSASNGWSGTGALDALLFGKPTWPHVQVRRTWIIPSAKLTSAIAGLSIPIYGDLCRRPKASKCVPALGGYTRLHTPVRG